MRIGWGVDAHRFGPTPPVKLAGVVVDQQRGVEATSDGDVVAHAVADALLGAAGLGDLGVLFPSSDARWEGADSMELLREVVARCRAGGVVVAHADVTIIAQSVRVAPFRQEMRQRLGEALEVSLEAISVKATTTDGMGFLGRDEGIAAVALISAQPPPG